MTVRTVLWAFRWEMGVAHAHDLRLPAGSVVLGLGATPTNSMIEVVVAVPEPRPETVETHRFTTVNEAVFDLDAAGRFLGLWISANHHKVYVFHSPPIEWTGQGAAPAASPRTVVLGGGE